jgi:hypothetical protein
MRALLASTAIALLIGLSPAAAAMCGGGGGGQQQSMSGGQSGGMCSSSGASKQMSEWPARDADGQKQEGQKQGMAMCGCCKDMAMMGGMKGDDPHKGMDMPKN